MRDVTVSVVEANGLVIVALNKAISLCLLSAAFVTSPIRIVGASDKPPPLVVIIRTSDEMCTVFAVAAGIDEVSVVRMSSGIVVSLLGSV
jgi:hypothetical protein